MELIAQSATGKISKALALAAVVRALAATEPDRAERTARSIANEMLKASALVDIATAAAATDPDRAERIAQSITRAFYKVQALVAIAESLVNVRLSAGQLQGARRRATAR